MLPGMGTHGEVRHPAWEWREMGMRWRVHHTGGVTIDHVSMISHTIARDAMRWSRFAPASQIARICRTPGVPIEVDAETCSLLSACDRGLAVTDGAFNVLVGDVLAAWGYRARRRISRPGTAVSPAPDAVPDSPIVINERRRLVQVPRGTWIDLGGIAPMWSARKAADVLRNRSDDPELLLECGNDFIAVRGDHAIELSGYGGPDGVILREGHGLARSASGDLTWLNGDGIEANHLIDPATASPVANALAIVACPDPIDADVLSTALAVRPELLPTMEGASFVHVKHALLGGAA